MSAGTVSFAQPAAIDPSLYRIRDLVYRAAGIYQPDTKLGLLADRCGRRMQELQVRTLRDYLEHLTQPGADRGEMVKLLNEVTIGETCFFRNRPQLDALKSIVWPRIIEARASTPFKKLRIWSAGCSTGEEPYTLAQYCPEDDFGNPSNTLEGKELDAISGFFDLNSERPKTAFRGRVRGVQEW